MRYGPRVQSAPLVRVSSRLIMSMRFRPAYIFFFNDTATTEIYTLSLHDALPSSCVSNLRTPYSLIDGTGSLRAVTTLWNAPPRSEEHTSELQSHVNLVCRLLLEKKKKKIINMIHNKKKKQKKK